MLHARLSSGLAMLCAALLPLLAPTAWAGSGGAPLAVVVSTTQPQIQVVGQSARTLTSAEFAEMRGEYRLSSGGLLVMGGARHRPVVELNDQAPLALLPVGPNRLVSADGKLRMEFKTEANGEVSGLTVHVAPGLL